MMKFSPIGIIHSPFKEKSQCPIQAVYSNNNLATIEINKEHAAGLKDIEMFSHIYILYLLDRAGAIKYIRPTFLDDTPHGIYASRHPCRPNSIGMSIVKLVSVKNNILTVAGIDVLDQTPLLDIKPYLPKFDKIEDATNGWAEDKEWRKKPEGFE